MRRGCARFVRTGDWGDGGKGLVGVGLGMGNFCGVDVGGESSMRGHVLVRGFRGSFSDLWEGV